MSDETRLFIEGRWQDGDGRFALLDKFTGAQIAEVAEANSDQVSRAVTH